MWEPPKMVGAMDAPPALSFGACYVLAGSDTLKQLLEAQ